MKDDKTMLLFGVAVLAFLGFLAWRVSATSSKLTVTSFTRDDQGRIIDIVEKQNEK